MTTCCAQVAVYDLTTRERDVAQLLVRGATNKEIARLLYIARGTVNAHVAAILAKTKAGNRTEAAYRLGSGV